MCQHLGYPNTYCYPVPITTPAPVATMLPVTMGPRTLSADLVWSDKFNYTDIWTYDIGTGSNGWGNQELQYYTVD
jgi:hypothetical protein